MCTYVEIKKLIINKFGWARPLCSEKKKEEYESEEEENWHKNRR